MAAREPTRHQLSSRLAYNARTPAFLQKLQNQVNGRPMNEDEDEPQYFDGGVDEFGRERRPPSPEPPEKDEGKFDDEDDPDERPTVVVLKEGMHLNEEEAENERRKARGLPPLSPELSQMSAPQPRDNTASTSDVDSSTKLGKAGLSFTSSQKKGNVSTSAKRKTLDGNDKESTSQLPKKRKSKKDAKGLLSFGGAI